MKIRWRVTEDTPLRYVEEGTVAETDDELAKRLIAEGIAEPVRRQGRAVKPTAKKAVKD